jgi:uncharacterized protein YoxC
LLIPWLFRLIKNRESAQKSRLRKKLYIEELEAKVTTLSTQGERLMQENAKLREDVSNLSKYIRSLKPGAVIDVDAPSVGTGSGSSSATSTAVGQHQVAPATVRRVAGVAPKNVKAAGICLLIVLFSFGLFFNAKHGPNGPALPYEPSHSLDDASFGRRIGTRGYAGKMLKAFREVGGSTITGEVSDLSETYPTRRGLPELASASSGPDDEDNKLQKKRRAAGLPAITALPVPEREKPIFIDADTDTDTDDDDDDLSPVSSPMTDIETMTALNEDTDVVIVDGGKEDNAEMLVDPSAGKAVVGGLTLDPRKAYIMCTKTVEILATAEEEADEEVDSGKVSALPGTRSPAMVKAPISMLIPKDALNETLSTTGGEESNDADPPMIEVSCQLRSSAVSVS